MGGMSMEEFVVQLGEIERKLAHGFVSTKWQDRLAAVKQEISEMIIEVMTNKPYSTVYTEQDEANLAAIEAEIAKLIETFRAKLDEEPWINPTVMKELREAGDGLSAKVAELRKKQRRLYPGAPVSLTPDPIADLPQNRIGLHPDCDKGFKLSHIIHAAGTQHLAAFADHSPGMVEKIFAPKGMSLWDMHTFSAIM